ncbi:MAG: lysylphosphatidylglycerol synthase domain-containing protein, partial [Flavobacteriales bacterium]
MKSKTTTRLIGLVGILISVACIALLGRSIDFSKTWEVIRQVNPLMVVAMMAIYLLTFPLRSMRWRIMM